MTPPRLLSPAGPAATPSAGAAVLRRCACGGRPRAGGECEQCRGKRRGLQRSALSAGPALAPPSVHRVLASPGRPLDAATRAFMEPRFGHSFADVRVHADGQAADSARAVGARAYAVGRHVVFASGAYAPETTAGQRLLAHELAHVVQQGGRPAALQARLELGRADDAAEREAERSSRAIAEGGRPTVSLRLAPSLAMQNAGAMHAPAAATTPPFKITLNDCDKAPFDEAAVRTAARAAYDKVLNSGCVKSESLRQEILHEFDDLDIDCEQGDADSPCGQASRYFTETINIYPPALNSSTCGPLESTILHEVVHLTEWRLFGHGELADACEMSCFGYGTGDASKCK